jgi:hypothetical protein
MWESVSQRMREAEWHVDAAMAGFHEAVPDTPFTFSDARSKGFAFIYTGSDVESYQAAVKEAVDKVRCRRR